MKPVSDDTQINEDTYLAGCRVTSKPGAYLVPAELGAFAGGSCRGLKGQEGQKALHYRSLELRGLTLNWLPLSSTLPGQCLMVPKPIESSELSGDLLELQIPRSQPSSCRCGMSRVAPGKWNFSFWLILCTVKFGNCCFSPAIPKVCSTEH